ncbi:hypothetical protein [Rhizobium lentis]|uniref:Uncharacterized protein n=1 Tax=Rhizobium lentis TaxID=1138194 RepID=A0A7W8XL28_9HYPH|nr:hypothetical protein [Rhizobium lentis]MBB5554227.1 hypothetical protein [Rhizobium lentis]MBB5564842.1 hypothetical protein [Rhizobium lentis]MBB5571353.1 hypothetical protein [Rhizobium lentis]
MIDDRKDVTLDEMVGRLSTERQVTISRSALVVRLPDGRRRSIRRSATDLAAAWPEARSESKSAPRISVRTLLTLMRHLNSMVTFRS